VTEPHHEPSYYEIALTNRQVVVAFVILLACLLAAFFSGVWIGRGGIEPHRDQMVRATPPPAAPTEGRTLEELKFFADRQTRKGDRHDEKVAEAAPAPTPSTAPPTDEKPAPAAAVPSVTPPGSTLQQDLGRRARRTPPAPAPAAEEATAEEPARPEPVKPRPSNRTAPPSDTASAKPGAGPVVIQVFATADQAEANRVRDRLGKGGQSAFLSPITVDGRTMYRVRIGPFTTRPKAQQVAEKVRKNFKLDTWLTQ
jgi:cell division septation protein DedD